ncbi:MAG: ribosome recycling factor [Bacteroidales bacterium]|jgi:ribosome recycling factor|nr:ribosome recycling factor [Bacteroidales bacterium]NLK80757.1 ribosome recycling factor [Bacteroidales bacterium]HPY82111.1 ribosome recycling factor [Bacteroidales bacterium]
MEEEVQLILEDTEERMQGPLRKLDSDLSKLRAGKASPTMLDAVKVDYYGTMTPISQVANINTPDPRTLVVQPWEKGIIATIEKAILQANLGLTPINDGQLIRINIPVLTEERRKELVRQVKNESENAKVSVRNIRRDANEMLKKLQKDGLAEDVVKQNEIEIQKITDSAIEKIDKKVAVKEEDLLTV